jgi:predicted alpha/beta hydrolase family esterase
VGGKPVRVLALALALAACGEERAERPSPTPPTIGGCLAERGGIRHVELDGRPAAVAGSGPAGIVTVSGGTGYICQWEAYARELAAAGDARVLMVDFADDPVAETLAAARWLERDGAERVTLMGASIGGAIAVHAAAEAGTEVDGLITLSAPSEPDRYVGAVAPAARRLTDPALHAGSKEDGYTYFGRDTRRIHRATGSRTKELALVPGGDHGVDSLTPRLKATIAEFIGG